MRITLLAVALALSASVLPASAQAVMQHYQLNIPRQSLNSALKDLANQTGLQIARLSDAVNGSTIVGPVSGDVSAEEALKALLESTGLSYRVINERTIAVMTSGMGNASSSNATGVGAVQASGDVGESAGTERQGGVRNSSFWERFQLAQTPEGASAQGSPSVGKGNGAPKAAELEEVIVTAQKREERLIDVPISIVTLSSDELQNRKLTSLDDLQFAVPGMGITSDGVLNKIELRGVSNVEGVSPLVGVYIDEADVTNSAGSQINPNTYDLERVEVLRGPQGTLYGEGSAGGTIRFITKSPVLDRFGMTASVASLFTQDGSPGERINTAINVPLIDQELGVRLVGTYDREGGWIDQPAAGLKDINGQDLTNVRVKGLWRPSPQFSASFMAEFYRNDRSTGNYEDAGGNFTQLFNLTTTPKASENHDIYNLTLTYDFPLVKFLSTTSYFREKFDAKDMGYSAPGLPAGAPPYNLYYTNNLRSDRAWVEELRLSSIGPGPWHWTVGGFYRHYRAFYDQPVSYSGQLGPPGTPLPASYAYQSDTLFKSWSVFGDLNWTLWERFTLGVGVRSFQEDQHYVQTYDFGDGDGPTTAIQAGRFHSVDPRVYAQYKLSRDVNIYASVAKGFRSGGFNAFPFQPKFAPEDVRTYELGAKMSVAEGRLRAETAVFYTDYKDYVVSGYTSQDDLNPADINAGNARLKGVEWDLVWRPSHQWSLGINGDYLDTRFTKINATSTAYEVGDPLDFVPKYQVTTSVERDFAWNDKQVSMRLDYTRRGRMTQRNRALGPLYYAESDVVNLLGYYMNLYWSQNLSFNLFAQNLLNDRGLTTPSLGSPVRSRPRTYGVGFDVAF